MTVMDTLPRARGGISTRSASCSRTLSSSPRTRGYFRSHLPAGAPCMLFPAHAGVFPWQGTAVHDRDPLPRARGGISNPRHLTGRGAFSSPRTRGYFPVPNCVASLKHLFPAHAGVFPIRFKRPPVSRTLPRARGGISVLLVLATSPPISSPRTRGYFHVIWGVMLHRLLFPAHAGVFPRSASPTIQK